MAKETRISEATRMCVYQPREDEAPSQYAAKGMVQTVASLTGPALLTVSGPPLTLASLPGQLPPAGQAVLQ
jgi:hypothetical protein